MQRENTAEQGRYAQFYSAHTIKNNLFTGSVSLSRIMQEGDFGIGTFNNTNGEMIVVDGVIYRLCADGSAEQIADLSEQTPYAALTHFQADLIEQVDEPMNMDETVASLDKMINHTWDIQAVLIRGRFQYIRTRAPEPQYPPYKDLETLIREQNQTEFNDIDGTMVGFYTPSYLDALGVPGYHFHFIDDTRRHGGHVQDFVLQQASLFTQRMREVLMYKPGGDIADREEMVQS